MKTLFTGWSIAPDTGSLCKNNWLHCSSGMYDYPPIFSTTEVLISSNLDYEKDMMVVRCTFLDVSKRYDLRHARIYFNAYISNIYGYDIWDDHASTGHWAGCLESELEMFGQYARTYVTREDIEKAKAKFESLKETV